MCEHVTIRKYRYGPLETWSVYVRGKLVESGLLSRQAAEREAGEWTCLDAQECVRRES